MKTSQKINGQSKPRTAEAAYVAEARIVPYTSWFGAIPATVEPSRPIVYAGTALVVAIAASLGIDAGIIAAAHAAAGWTNIFLDVNGGLGWLVGHLSLGRIDADAGEVYSYTVATQGGALRVAVSVLSTLAGITAGVIAWRWAARPQVAGVKHLRGPLLLEGKEALAEARRHAIQRKKGDKSSWPLFALPLIEQERVWLPKNVFSRSVLIYGSPGAGKTIVINGIVRALVSWKKAKALVWDAKSDYTSAYYGLPGVAILSPYDERSVHWCVGLDAVGSTGAQVLASVLASGGGSSASGAQSDFFQQAATTVLIAALETVQAKHGTAWGWDTFSEMFSVDRATLLKTLLDAGHKEVDELIGTADAKSSSVMATVGNAIAMTRTLGRAWPYQADRPKSECFSVREWMSDDYDTKRQPRILLVKGDDFPELIGRCLVAMTNILAIGINGLGDNERGRCLAVVCDEIAALKSRISIAEYISTGRSAGALAVLGLQDLHQLVPIYGPDTTKALASMAGLHIVGRTNMGATRDEIAEHLGRRVVAVRAHGTENGTVTEQEQPVVLGSYLSHDLGPFGRVVTKDENGKTSTRAQGVRLLVHGLGPNVLRLEWPIVPLPKRAPGKVPAKWTLMPETKIEPVGAVEVVVEQASAETIADPTAETGSDEITAPGNVKDLEKDTGPILAPAEEVTAITTETPSIAGDDMSWAG
jgi:hypothetical protein